MEQGRRSFGQHWHIRAALGALWLLAIVVSAQAEAPTPAPSFTPVPALTSSPTRKPTPGVMMTLAPETTRYPTEEYATREDRLAEYRQELTTAGCKQGNLDFCARLLDTVDSSDAISDTSYTMLEKTILKYYLSRTQVIEFGVTGNGLDIVYFKDGKGRKTDVPALCYIGASDYNVGLKQVQKAIDQWEKDSPGFLQSLYANDVCVFFQNKANVGYGIQSKYENGIIYLNCGLDDKKVEGSDFVKYIRMVLGVEMFGNKMEVLGGEFFGATGFTGAALKGMWAEKCSEYIFLKTGKKFYQNRANSYHNSAEGYISRFDNIDEVLYIMNEAETNNLVTPFVDATWDEINKAIEGKISFDFETS